MIQNRALQKAIVFFFSSGHWIEVISSTSGQIIKLIKPHWFVFCLSYERLGLFCYHTDTWVSKKAYTVWVTQNEYPWFLTIYWGLEVKRSVCVRNLALFTTILPVTQSLNYLSIINYFLQTGSFHFNDLVQITNSLVCLCNHTQWHNIYTIISLKHSTMMWKADVLHV